MTFQPASRPSTPTRHRAGQPPRRGFTLIELMVVIVVIAMLIAILVPAVTAVISRTRMAAAKTEIGELESAIADFKSEYGMDPPSQISFVLDGSGQLPSPTKATLRKMFPQINFADPDLVVDLNRAGLTNKVLFGPESLVFFLGGVRRGDGTTFRNELLGFSKNPSRPLMQPGTGQSTRLGPFMDFDTERLCEIDRSVDPANPVVSKGAVTGVPLAYLDRLEGQANPFLYASTARTGAYINADIPELPGGPYQKPDNTYHNPTSFQIISPGFDLEYGSGGVIPASGATGRAADNLTNFAEGTLGG